MPLFKTLSWLFPSVWLHFSSGAYKGYGWDCNSLLEPPGLGSAWRFCWPWREVLMPLPPTPARGASDTREDGLVVRRGDRKLGLVAPLPAGHTAEWPGGVVETLLCRGKNTCSSLRWNHEVHFGKLDFSPISFCPFPSSDCAPQSKWEEQLYTQRHKLIAMHCPRYVMTRAVLECNFRVFINFFNWRKGNFLMAWLIKKKEFSKLFSWMWQEWLLSRSQQKGDEWIQHFLQLGLHIQNVSLGRQNEKT